ncbi:MAG: SctK family type III secretion system sorting platform protein [Desulfobacterales bacterium]|nr:SctK family type III secretion system sorting platform protein [Desulfobacterales bacterium]
MAETFFKTALKQQDELWPLIIQFNLQPVTYIHKNKISIFLKEPLFQTIAQNQRGKKHLSNIILSALKLQNSFDFDFSAKEKRFALLDGETLFKLTFYTGAALSASLISKIIERKALLNLKKAIGEDMYRFALKKAPFLIKQSHHFGLEQWETEDFKSQLFERGLKCFSAIFMNVPESTTKRIALKFPTDFTPNFTLSFSMAEQKEAFQILFKILTSEVQGPWQKYII